MREIYDSWLQPSFAPLPRWRPPADLTDPQGAPLSKEVDFFHPPPSEIGEILYAFSDLQEQETGRWFFGLLPDLSSIHCCLYVGSAGVARYSLELPRENGRGGQVLRFDQAAFLRTQSADTFDRHRLPTDGAVLKLYRDTKVDLVWLTRDKRPFYGYRDHVHKDKKTESIPWRFAAVAEQAWTNFLLPQAEDRLAKNEAVLFPLDGGGELRIGRGYLEYTSPESDRACRWTAQEAPLLAFTERSMAMIHPGLSPAGTKEIIWQDILNLRLFGILARKHFLPAMPITGI